MGYLKRPFAVILCAADLTTRWRLLHLKRIVLRLIVRFTLLVSCVEVAQGKSVLF